MSAGIKNVSVIRSEYTPRDSYLNGLTGKISLTLKTLSYIHIGSGAFKLYVDINVVKRFIEYFKRRGFDYALSSMSDKITKAISYDFSAFTRYGDKITIPGSTIKGLLRSRLELLFKGTSGSTNACFSKAGIPLSVVPNKGLHGWRHVRIWGNVVFENRGPPCNLTSLGTNVCKVCDIFGAPGLASRVFVGNFYPVNNNVTERKELEYGEKLEVVKPGVTFKGDITFHSLTLDELGLIFIGLGAKKDGTFVPILIGCLLYTSPSPRDLSTSRMPSSA